MTQTTMLYKHGTMLEIDGKHYDYVVVENTDVDTKVKEGWSLYEHKDSETKKLTVKKTKAVE